MMCVQMYDADRGSPRSLPGTSKAAVPSPLVYDVVEDSSVYDMGPFTYIEDSTRHGLPVCLWLPSSVLYAARQGQFLLICINFTEPEGGSQQ